MMKDVDISDDAFKHIEAIIQSMTKEERENPDVINGNRKKRIAMGAGRSIEEVNKLMKQFEDMKKMMKMFNNGGANPLKMMKNNPFAKMGR
jgi:signal recognition particle subunit SRP54